MSVEVFAVLSVVCVWMPLLNVPLVSCGTKCFWQLRTKENLGTSGLRCELERCGSGAPDSGIISRQTMHFVLKASLSSLEKGVCVNSWTSCSSFHTSAEKKKDCRFSKGTWFLCVFIVCVCVCACGSQRITFLAGPCLLPCGRQGYKNSASQSWWQAVLPTGLSQDHWFLLLQLNYNVFWVLAGKQLCRWSKAVVNKSEFYKLHDEHLSKHCWLRRHDMSVLRRVIYMAIFRSLLIRS